MYSTTCDSNYQPEKAIAGLTVATLSLRKL